MANRTFANRGMHVLEDVSSDMERVFDSFLGQAVGPVLRNASKNGFLLDLDVSETTDFYRVEADLPGVAPENVSVEIHDGKLLISGGREISREEKDACYHRAERTSGSFQRSISLPNEIDADKIEARYEHGVLSVTLPKLAKPQPKKIEIKR